MLSDYSDIMALADGTAPTKTPLWWDENGCPRFALHEPELCPDIYADEVALVRIACQSCRTEFDVQMSTSTMTRVMGKLQSLARQVIEGSIHYGDPPRHDVIGDEGCFTGASMNVYDLRVLQFWARDHSEWKRKPELEIELPDAKVPSDSPP